MKNSMEGAGAKKKNFFGKAGLAALGMLATGAGGVEIGKHLSDTEKLRHESDVAEHSAIQLKIEDAKKILHAKDDAGTRALMQAVGISGFSVIDDVLAVHVKNKNFAITPYPMPVQEVVVYADPSDAGHVRIMAMFEDGSKGIVELDLAGDIAQGRAAGNIAKTFIN